MRKITRLRLKALRERAGLSQRALDREVGVGHSRTRRLEEHGWGELEVAARYAKALGCTLDELAGLA